MMRWMRWPLAAVVVEMNLIAAVAMMALLAAVAEMALVALMADRDGPGCCGG